MKAVCKIKEGPGNLVYQEVPEPSPAAGQVKIRVHSCGICGSDMKFYLWTMRPGMNIPIPVIFGHEYSGVIVETGRDVTRWKIGDRVTSETTSVICKNCEQCMTGHPILCPAKRSIGYQCDGAMAEYLCIREEIVHRVPDNVSLEEAAVTEPACVAQHAVFDLANVRPGDTVLIFGPGPIGLLAAQMAKACGARVLLAGLASDSRRLELGCSLGADQMLLVDQCDVVQAVREATGGRGAETVFECSGSARALDQGILCAKKRGSVVEVALFHTGAQTLGNLNTLVNNEITLRGSYGQRFPNWDRSLQLMSSGQLSVAPLISHRFALSKCQEAFETARSGEGIKILLQPQKDHKEIL